MDIWKISAASHEALGRWCKCGELASQCFMLTVILPSRRIMSERMYSDIFAGVEAT